MGPLPAEPPHDVPLRLIVPCSVVPAVLRSPAFKAPSAPQALIRASAKLTASAAIEPIAVAQPRVPSPCVGGPKAETGQKGTFAAATQCSGHLLGLPAHGKNTGTVLAPVFLLPMYSVWSRSMSGNAAGTRPPCAPDNGSPSKGEGAHAPAVAAAGCSVPWLWSA